MVDKVSLASSGCSGLVAAAAAADSAPPPVSELTQHGRNTRETVSFFFRALFLFQARLLEKPLVVLDSAAEAALIVARPSKTGGRAGGKKKKKKKKREKKKKMTAAAAAREDFHRLLAPVVSAGRWNERPSSRVDFN